MKKIPKQTVNGKAFEFALLVEFFNRLQILTNVKVVKNEPYEVAQKCSESISIQDQQIYSLTASFAVNFLLDIEPRLSNGINKGDTLQLEIVSDKQGQIGDVRDVLAIRALQKWEIGISAKNNHRAVKHSRLSKDIDFGEKWLGLNCSDSYFGNIIPIFENLAILRSESKATKTWKSLGDYHSTIYLPILKAFQMELLSLNSRHPLQVAQRLVEYLIGNQDFYKVIKSKNKVEIQAYNLHGTLNQALENIKPKAKVGRVKLPDRLIEVVFQDDSKTTLLVTLSEGWQISFRIHNASSRIEPSLKFDINLVSAPHSLFTNHLFIN